MDEFGADEIARVRAEHAQNEQAVGLEVVVHKVTNEVPLKVVNFHVGHVLEVERLLAAPKERLTHNLNATAYVTQALRRQEAIGPHAQTVDVDDEHNAVPKPDECEYLLIEQVYGQNTLDRVAMADFRVADLANSKVTHAYLGKDARARVPALAVENLVEELEAELVEFVAEQKIEHEQLTDAVGDEREFDEQVEHHEIVAEKLAAYAADTGEHALEEYGAARFLATPRVVYVLVDGGEHVAHVLLSILVFVDRLVVTGRLDYVAYVDAGAARECAPRNMRNVEEERLREKNKRHPLVVLELEALPNLISLGQLLVQRNVVGVGNPADVVDVLFVVSFYFSIKK